MRGVQLTAQILACAAIRGVSRRRFVTTTRRAVCAAPVRHLVPRDFSSGAQNQLWVTDIRYLPTWADSLCLAVVVDASTRREVEWARTLHLMGRNVCCTL